WAGLVTARNCLSVRWKCVTRETWSVVVQRRTRYPPGMRESPGTEPRTPGMRGSVWGRAPVPLAMLQAAPGVTVMPQASQGQCRVECGHRRLPSLVLGAAGQPAAFQCLLNGVTCEDPVAHRRRLIERDAGHTRGDGVAHVVEMRGGAADDRAEADDGVEVAGQLLRDHRQLQRARDAGDDRVVDAARLGGRERAVQQLVGDAPVPAGRDDAEREPG